LSQNSVKEKDVNLKEIENKALQLSGEERAELAQKLLLSLEVPTELEIEKEWMIEAYRRARELDAGIVQPIPAEEVRKKAQALLR
jgi:putative addiction module component (TIGR02574 family)